MVVLHTSVNNTSGYWLPAHDGVQLVLLPLLLVLVLVDRMYRRAGGRVGSNVPHPPKWWHAK